MQCLLLLRVSILDNSRCKSLADHAMYFAVHDIQTLRNLGKFKSQQLSK
jgi:hypothetical protein